jgi:hypothetical protein
MSIDSCAKLLLALLWIFGIVVVAQMQGLAVLVR